jgi:hypothetical protein
MKKIFIVSILSGLLLQGCIDPYYDEYPKINLGEKSINTNIKSIFQSDNLVTVEFETTIGSKYSVQIIQFGQEIPIRKEGFTATNTTTRKVYDLTKESVGYYDLIFIDITGKDVKYPIMIK